MSSFSALAFSPAFAIDVSYPVAVVGVDVPDHVAIALTRLPEQFKRSTQMIAIVAALVRPLQDVEAAAWLMNRTRALGTAQKAQLDLLGKIAGQLRNGQGETLYRRYIAAKIATNRSRSLADELIRIAKLILGGGRIEVRQSGNAAVRIVIHDTSVDDDLANALVFFLTAAVGAGVRLTLSTRLQSDADTFTTRASFRTGGSLAIGTTSVIATAPATLRNFPHVGFITIGFGGANPEVHAYRKNADRTALLLDAATTHSFTTHTLAVLTDSAGNDLTVGKGFGTTSSPGTGGKFSSARSLIS